MLTEKQLDRYADVLIWGLKTSRSSSLKSNDIFLIRYDLAALRLTEILQAKLTKRLREGLGFNDSALHWDLVNTEKNRLLHI